MSEILVTFGELESAQNSIRMTSANITREMEDLKRYLQPMMETWSGEASIAYRDYQAKWDQAATDLNQVLNTIGVALGTSNQNYQEGERVNTGRWS